MIQCAQPRFRMEVYKGLAPTLQSIRVRRPLLSTRQSYHERRAQYNTTTMLHRGTFPAATIPTQAKTTTTLEFGPIELLSQQPQSSPKQGSLTRSFHSTKLLSQQPQSPPKQDSLTRISPHTIAGWQIATDTTTYCFTLRPTYDTTKRQ